MRHHTHRLFWTGLLVYAGALAVSSLIIAVFWGMAPAVAALCASAGALGVVALCAEPWRHLKAIKQRRTKCLDLGDDLNIETPPGNFVTFLLTGGALLMPGPGHLFVGSKKLSTGAWSKMTIETTAADKGSVVLTLSGEPEAQKLEARVHPAKLSAFYWACWRLCQQNQWTLATPLGDLSHPSPELPLIERIQSRLGWLEGQKGALDLDDLHGPVKSGAGAVPLCEADKKDRVSYRFPDGSAPAVMDDGLSAEAHEHRLRLLTLACLLGVVTAPLALLAHSLRVRPPGHLGVRSLELGRGTLKIDRHTEALDSLEAVTAFPVHKGPPLVLTRRNALFVGGLDDYDERIAWGRHLLERSAALAGDQRFSHRERELDPYEAPGSNPRTGPLGWLKSLTLPRVVLASAAMLFAVNTLDNLMDYWSPFWTFYGAGIGLDIVYGALPWWRSFTIAGALIFAVLLLERHKGTPRWPMALQGLVTMPLAAVLAFALQPVVNPIDYDRLAFDPGDKRLHFSDWGQMAGFDVSMVGADLRHFDFSSYPLGAVDMSNANLTHVDLSSSNLTGANLINADARRARFDGASLKGALLTRGGFEAAGFGGADLDRVDADQARFDKASLTGASLRGALLRDASLIGADLSGADLSGADLRGAQLSMANLTCANLAGANLAGASLARANVSGANTEGAFLTHTNTPLTDTITFPRTVCPNLKPSGQGAPAN